MRGRWSRDKYHPLTTARRATPGELRRDPPLARTRTLALAAVGFLAAVALAQEPSRLEWSRDERAALDKLKAQSRRDGRFWVASGSVFDVRSDISPTFAAECALYLDDFARLFDATLPVGREPDVRPEAIVYAREADFRRRTGRAGRGWTPYTFDGLGRVIEVSIITYADGDAELSLAGFYRPILHHEGAHALMRRGLSRASIPPWFDEGVATWLQFVDPREPRAVAFARRDARSQFLWRLQPDVESRHLMPLVELLSKTRAEWEPDPDSGAHNEFGPITMRNYAYAESFVSSLLASPEGPRFLARAYESIRDGRDPLESVGKDELHRLEVAWHAALPAQARARKRT